jgi:hypothetical protein
MSTPEIRKRYRPPRYTLTQWLKLVRGWIRFRFGFCPACNSDAPGLYDCPVCGGWRTWGDGYVEQRIDRRLWWNRFKTRLRLKDYGR